MILVSACLLGIHCKYNGEHNYNEAVVNYLKDKNYIPVCPEQLGGLSTPRLPCEIIYDRVINTQGIDVTEQFEKGAQETLTIAQLSGATTAILKSKSPSCGSRKIYDGSFSHSVIDGQGITAACLENNKIQLLNEIDIENLESSEMV
jgi:uncharacterized protein YbbK (DUF523 family)